MQTSAVTFVKAAGKSVPPEFLANALTKFCQSVGLAMPLTTHVEVAKRSNAEITNVEEIAATINDPNLMGQTILVNLQSDAPVFGDDVGPHTILENSEGKPLLVAALDGDFSEYKQDSSEHTAESFAIQSITGRIKNIYGYANGDIDKLMDMLGADEYVAKDFVNMMAGDRGTITLMSANGRFLHFETKGDDSHGDTDFGWTSNKFTPVAAKVEEKPKAAGFFGGIFGSSKSTAEPAPPKPAEVPAPSVQPPGVSPGRSPGKSPASVPQVASTSPAPSLKPGTSEEWLEIPVPANSFHGDLKKRRKWFSGRVQGGFVPTGWETATTLKLTKSGATRKFLEDWGRQQGMKAVGAISTSSPADAPKTDTAVPPTPAPSVPPISDKSELIPAAVKQGAYPPKPEEKLRKDTSTHTVSNGKPGILVGPIAIIPPGQKAKIMSILEDMNFKGAVDRHSQLIADPAEWQKLEDKIPNFAHQLGIGETILATMNWPYDQILRIGKEAGIEALATLVVNWRSEWLQMQKFCDQLMEDQKKTETNQPKTLQAAVNETPVSAPTQRKFAGSIFGKK